MADLVIWRQKLWDKHPPYKEVSLYLRNLCVRQIAGVALPVLLLVVCNVSLVVILFNNHKSSSAKYTSDATNGAANGRSTQSSNTDQNGTSSSGHENGASMATMVSALNKPFTILVDGKKM